MDRTPLLKLADAICTAINAEQFDVAFTAERRHVPAFDLENTTDLRVQVVPAAMAFSSATRGTRWIDCTVDIGIMQRARTEPRDEIDLLADLVFAIAAYLDGAQLAAYPEAKFLDWSNEPVFDPATLKQNGVYVTRLRVRYRTQQVRS